MKYQRWNSRPHICRACPFSFYICYYFYFFFLFQLAIIVPQINLIDYNSTTVQTLFISFDPAKLRIQAIVQPELGSIPDIQYGTPSSPVVYCECGPQKTNPAKLDNKQLFSCFFPRIVSQGGQYGPLGGAGMVGVQIGESHSVHY